MINYLESWEKLASCEVWEESGPCWSHLPLLLSSLHAVSGLCRMLICTNLVEFFRRGRSRGDAPISASVPTLMQGEAPLNYATMCSMLGTTHSWFSGLKLISRRRWSHSYLPPHMEAVPWPGVEKRLSRLSTPAQPHIPLLQPSHHISAKSGLTAQRWQVLTVAHIGQQDWPTEILIRPSNANAGAKRPLRSSPHCDSM